MQLVKFRTAQINALHGTLLEFGESIHKGRAAMEREFPEALERMKERLPPYLIMVLENQYNRLNELDSLIEDIENSLPAWRGRMKPVSGCWIFTALDHLLRRQRWPPWGSISV